MSTPSNNTEDYDEENNLLTAVEDGEEELVKEMIEAGADINMRDCMENQPLHIAAMNCHVNIIQMLIDAGADVNALGYEDLTPVQYAVRSGRHEDAEACIRLLVSNGASLDTVLFDAVAENMLEIIPLLLELGADINTSDMCGLTALEFATMDGRTEIVKLLEAAIRKQNGLVVV